MAEYGIPLGLAVRLTDETAAIRARGAQERQAQALQEHKAAMVADDMKFNTPMNAYDRVLAQKEGQDGAMKLGNFVASNPGWETNVQARTMYNQLKDSITKGDNFTIGVLSDKAYKDWQDDMAKNPDKLDPEDYAETNAQWQEYQKTGMYNGKRQPFMYVAPTPFNMEEEVTAAAKSLEMRSRGFSAQDKLIPQGPGAYMEDVTFDRAYTTADGILKDVRKSNKISKEWAKVPEGERKIYEDQGNGQNGMAIWLAHQIQDKKGSQYNPGSIFAPKDSKGKDSNGLSDTNRSPYIDHIGVQPSNWDGASTFAPNLLDINYNEATGKGEYYSKDASVIIENTDGSFRKFFIPGMQTVKYAADGREGLHKRNGVLYGEASFTIPINAAMGKNGKGHGNQILEDDTSNFKEGDLEYGDYKVLPQYKDNFEVELDKTTLLPTGNLVIKTLIKARTDDAFIQKYNAAVAGQKHAQDVQKGTMDVLDYLKNNSNMAPQSGGEVFPQTQAEWDKAPKGSWYIDANNKKHNK